MDWVDGREEAPLVVLFHGLGSSSRGHYARALAAAIQEPGWNLCLVNFRGCGGIENLLPRAYHAGDSAEIAWIIQRLHGNFPHRPLFAVGASLGGNALLKYLGENPDAPLAAAVAINAPVDLTATAAHIAQHPLYERYFVHVLQRLMRPYARRYPHLLDWEAVRQARTILAFDEAFTAPLHGFRNAVEYWRLASSAPLLTRIKTRSLLIHSRNDPIVPFTQVERWPRSPAVRTCWSQRGGHVAYVQGGFPGRLDHLPNKILQFLQGEEPNAETFPRPHPAA